MFGTLTKSSLIKLFAKHALVHATAIISWVIVGGFGVVLIIAIATLLVILWNVIDSFLWDLPYDKPEPDKCELILMICTKITC